MQLQRADAGDHVDHPGMGHPLQFGHERVDADPSSMSRTIGPVLDEDVAITLLAVAIRK